MFKDYYQILGITPDADAVSIKSAYRKQALKWHPDKHPNMDVKSIMQDINEAYAILKDPEKRSRYDKEYFLFKESHVNNSTSQKYSSSNKEQKYSNSSSDRFRYDYYYDYDVKNENLKEDIKNANEYASKLVDDFFSALKRNSKIAAEGAWDGAKWYVFSFIFLIILGFLIRACMA